MEKYFDSRMNEGHRTGADQVWRLVSADILRRIEAPVARVLDLGAGQGDFVNQVVASEKWAVDRWPGMKEKLSPSVRAVVGDLLERHAEIPESHFDLAFLSNVLEHFSTENAEKILAHAKAYVRPGGFVAILQPNFRFCYRRYFDDYTHKTAFTDEGLKNFLLDQGFALRAVVPRYLPFSFKSRLPRPLFAVWLYLRSPWKPLGAQMLVVAQVRK